jgi:hypothetical protein
MTTASCARTGRIRRPPYYARKGGAAEPRFGPKERIIGYTAGMATPEEARKAGCDEYFLKTDPLPKLRDKVRQYTSARPGPATL